MPQFPWVQHASIGVRRLDEEHALLLKLLSNVTKALQANRTPDAVRHALLFREAIAEHFLHEEGLMGVTRYVNANEHIRMHRDALKTVASLIASVEANAGRDVILALTDKIASDFHNSLLSADILLVKHLEQEWAWGNPVAM